MKYEDLNIKLMGTYIHIRILHEKSREILEECKSLLFKYNMIFSMYDKNSLLYKINKESGQKSTNVNKELYDLIKLGKKHSLDEYSNLNIAIAPLVKLWNIGFKNAKVPNNKELEKVLKYIDPKDITLEDKNKSIYLKENMQIDLGAIAKGYIADRIKDHLLNKNVKSAIIDLGGNILTIGFNFDRYDLNWHIGLQYPNLDRGNHAMMLEINDISIVTSGIYERKLVYNNKEYHHIFDTKTGYPIKSDMESISIVSKKSVDCDIYSSKLFGKDFDTIEKICNINKNIEAIAIYKNDKINYTKGIDKYILWKDEK